MKYTIIYHCGHQTYDFICAPEECVPARLAEYACQLCHSCQIAREQRQFEGALQANPLVHNVTDQNGHFLTATRTRPDFCQITVYDAEQVSLEEYEIEISQVTTDLYRRDYHNLYWSTKHHTYKPFN